MVGLLLVLAQFATVASPEGEPPPSVVLLVHGMKVDLSAPVDVWGTARRDRQHGVQWDGMIGCLERAGYRFGGVIRPQGATVQLPLSLDTTTGTIDASHANLFSLEFSRSANTDGLAYKTLELAACVAELRRFTGCQTVRLVTHSAGGLVARAYLQSALPGAAFQHDVDRLITISAPHLGSTLARHFGDFLGTRATSLRPEGELVRRLNEELPLPPDVLFASIVVRGVGIGLTGLHWSGGAFDDFVDARFLEQLPRDYQQGGDQVLQVRTQNLRLARCAATYEATNGRPVLYLLARVADPTPEDRHPLQLTAHATAPRNPMVQLQVELLLHPQAPLWRPLPDGLLATWTRLQASQIAFGVIEHETAIRHPLSEVQTTRLDSLELLARGASRRSYHFAGMAPYRARILGLSEKRHAVSGTLNLTFDRFGRILSAKHRTSQLAR